MPDIHSRGAKIDRLPGELLTCDHGSKTAKRLSELGIATVLELARAVAADIANEQRHVVRVVVKGRYAQFTTSIHSRALSVPSSDVESIEKAAVAALDAFTSRRPLRLLGVRAELEI